MSLFKTEELWSFKAGTHDVFNPNTLCVGNFSDNESNSDQLIVGNKTGTICLYKPLLVTNTNDQNPFKIDAQSVEVNVKLPIIQMLVGKFIVENKLNLAVLTPKKLLYFNIEPDLSALKVIDEFELNRIAYNMCTGKFGNANSAKDSLCIQSVDCTLSIFTGGYFLSNQIFPADSLLPGPLYFLPQADSLVTVSSSRRMIALYKYKNLASSPGQSKRLQPDSCINIGDSALEIEVTHINEEAGDLLIVLARFALYLVHNTTGLIDKQRFEVSCRHMNVYGVTNEGQVRYIILNSRSEALIFRGTTLVWKANLLSPDVLCLKTGKFNGVSGFLVGLTESGELFVNYLGTDPQMETMNASTGIRDEMQIEDQEEELRIIQAKITKINKEGASAIIPASIKTKEAKSFIKIIPDYSSASIENKEKENSDTDLRQQYHITIKLQSEIIASQVCLRVCTPLPFELSSPNSRNSTVTSVFNYPQFRAGPENSQFCPLIFYSSSTISMVARTLSVPLIVTYCTSDHGDSSSSQNLRITQTNINLPLSIIVEPAQPQKQAKFKVTLSTPLNSIDKLEPLSKIFPEFVHNSTSTNSDVAIACQYYNNGPIITILGHYESGRFRLQSSHFEAIYVVLKEFVNRVSLRSGIKLMHKEALPLDSYYLVLDYHYTIRQNLQKYNKELEIRSKQYRAIQKLFLTKIKDKTISDLQNIDFLTENSLNKLIQLTSVMNEEQGHLLIVTNALSASTSLIGCLISLANLNTESESIISSGFSSELVDYPELGLEEQYDEIFVYITKYLQKSQKKNTKDSIHLSMEKMQVCDNLDKVKKHLSLLCNKLSNPKQDSVTPSASNHELNQSASSNYPPTIPNIRLETVAEEQHDTDHDHMLPDFQITPRSKKGKSKKSKKKKLLSDEGNEMSDLPF